MKPSTLAQPNPLPRQQLPFWVALALSVATVGGGTAIIVSCRWLNAFCKVGVAAMSSTDFVCGNR